MDPNRVVEFSDGSCANQSDSFFNLPTWYKYLDCRDGDPVIDSLTDVWRIVGGIIDILIFVGGAAAVLFIIYGGIRMVTSQGQPDKVAQARQTLIYAAAGLVIAIIARVIVNYVFRQF